MGWLANIFTQIVAIIAAVRIPWPGGSPRGDGSSASSSGSGSNSSATSELYPARNATGKELYFFAHGDWGKSGYYDNDVNGRRLRRLPEDGGDHDGEHGEREDREEHDHDEEHDERGEREEEKFWQGAVARAMLGTANVTHPSFVLALGDNFYADGVSAVNDSLWNSHFRDVYFRSPELESVPWHPVIGNHDLGYGDSGVQAQVARTSASTSDDDGVWQMPSTNYTVKYTIPGTPGYLQVVAVDTTWLAPSENEATDEQSDSVKLVRLKSQLAHLYQIFQETLVHPRPTWLIVCGHYPLYSAADKSDNDELITYLLPFMEHFGVHAYFSGHDHINEHFTDSDGIEYYVAGASSMTNELDEDKTSEATLNWAGEDVAAFTRVTATTEELIVDYINVNQTVIYRYTQTNANPTPTPPPTSMPTSTPVAAPSPSPTSFPTPVPTVEVTYSFCDTNPDLCSSYLSSYGINLDLVSNITATMIEARASVQRLTNSTEDASEGIRPHHSMMVVVMSVTMVALLCMTAVAFVWKWSSNKSAYLGVGTSSAPALW